MNACRILDRLEKAELSEPDIWYRQDIGRPSLLCHDWYDTAGNRKPDIQKKTSAPVTPHPDEKIPVRLAAVLMFPKLKEAA